MALVLAIGITYLEEPKIFAENSGLCWQTHGAVPCKRATSLAALLSIVG